MKLTGKVIVVTGGGNGIGRALVQRFAAEKPRGLVIGDRDLGAAQRVAAETGGLAVACDVAREADTLALIAAARDSYGPVDLFCANAGVATSGGVDASDEEWRAVIDINFMSHVWAARALVPEMLARKSGYFLHTASAAGLLTMVGSAPYAVTKHSVVAFAEWLSVTHGAQGLRVSCLCPQFVQTQMLKELEQAGGASVVASGTIIGPEKVAEAVVAGLDAEQFLILPHPEVATYFQRKATDYDRWIGGMRKLEAKRLGG
jgi:NAD(P)-dependent dehydrogenase (short-subunit alcohol dehydrogenase family)